MFSGIIEKIGTITNLVKEGSNLHITVQSPFSKELKIDQSVAHNGVCLTVIKQDENTHTVTAIDESIQKSNIKDWKINSKLNLERCLSLNSLIDGHLVQGHVDTYGEVLNIIQKDGSWIFEISFQEKDSPLLVNKGSITVNGTSLTIAELNAHSFSIAIIPYTYENTNFHDLSVGDKVNLEFDIIGKYVQRLMSVK